MAQAKMWFGTADRMRWIPCPVRGASVGPESWGVGGTLLSGGGYVSHSWGSARHYIFEWRQSSSRFAAQTLHDYRDGVYGRGLIYFHDPLTLDTNVLPKQWAFPGLNEGRRDNPFLWGESPEGFDVPAGSAGLPARGARVSLPVNLTGLDQKNAVYVPIPEGHTFRFAAWFATASAAAGVHVYPVDHSGVVGPGERATPNAATVKDPAGIMYNSVTHRGVWVAVTKTTNPAATVDLYGMRGTLHPTGTCSFRVDGWIGGQGHSGCRFEGNPTYIPNTGVNGGQVSFAASFREVGDWQ